MLSYSQGYMHMLRFQLYEFGLKTFKFRHRLQNSVSQAIIQVSKPIFKTHGVKTGKTRGFT